MKQNSLFEESEKGCDGRAVASVGVAGSASTLTLLQKRYDKLVARLTARRPDIAPGRSFREAYDRRIAQECRPLGKQQRAEVRDILLLSQVFAGQNVGIKEVAKICLVSC
ncbi:MAG TPA: hypothetical protein VGO37_05190 [Steroidobacteraceae bacterium]|jgi:hypothetical protein|nr:hypothetical protein [Steroidobacteraceae bacterium]